MRTFRIGGLLIAAAATVLCVSATPAASAAAPPESGGSSLTLLIWGPNSASKGVELRCDPPGGSHPDPQAACADLTRAGGDFSRLSSGSVACTMELREVTAVAVGTWDGVTTRWHEKFSNPCVMRSRTASLFDF
jgi:Subtilisin inhibitor-like